MELYWLRQPSIASEIPLQCFLGKDGWFWFGGYYPNRFLFMKLHTPNLLDQHQPIAVTQKQLHEKEIYFWMTLNMVMGSTGAMGNQADHTFFGKPLAEVSRVDRTIIGNKNCHVSVVHCSTPSVNFIVHLKLRSISRLLPRDTPI